jgi:hypothetical protein
VRRAVPLLVALGLVAAVVVPYLALGGATYEPTPLADPCQTREWRSPGGLSETLEQIALSALDGVACDLGVSREDLVLALRDEDALDAFAKEHGLERADAERAIRDGLLRAVDDADSAGALPGFLVGPVRKAVESVPPWLLLDVLEQLGGFVP